LIVVVVVVVVVAVVSGAYYVYSHPDLLAHEAAVAQKPRPQLDAHHAEDEEDEEAEGQHVAQHGQRVQQQGHQDAHACRGHTAQL